MIGGDEMVVTIIIIVLFIALGFVFFSGKGTFLIAGYNTMPQAEKDKLDEIALCKFMGKMMFALAGCMVFWVLSEALDKQWLFFVGLALFFGNVLFLLVYMNTGNRFKK